MMADVLLVLQAIDLLVTSAMRAGVDFAAYNAARDKARAEGRQLSMDELKALADTAQKAIDAI